MRSDCRSRVAVVIIWASNWWRIDDCPQHTAGQAIKPANGYIGDQAGSQRGRYIDAVSEHRFGLRQKGSPVGELSTASIGCQLSRTATQSRQFASHTHRDMQRDRGQMAASGQSKIRHEQLKWAHCGPSAGAGERPSGVDASERAKTARSMISRHARSRLITSQWQWSAPSTPRQLDQPAGRML